MERNLNIIFTGNFTFPFGMAGTQIVGRFIDHCIENNINVKVLTILQRIKKNDKNTFKGIYKGKVPYFNFGIVTGNRLIDLVQYPIILFYAICVFVSLEKEEFKKWNIYL